MASSEFLDCELYLSAYNQAKLSVAGRDFEGQPDLDERLQNRLVELKLEPKQYGEYLFNALLPSEDDLLAGYRTAQAIARHEKMRLRFRFHIAATAPRELHDIHWEFLYDAKKKIALSRSRETAFSRYLGVDMEPGVAVTRKPKLLVVLSTPSNLAEYQLAELDREKLRRSTERALSSFEGMVRYEILEGPATLGRISEKLGTGEFHILHLQAHGLVRRDRRIASLVLEGDDGCVKCVDEADFTEIFEGERALRLVTLLACHSGSQSNEDPFSGLGPALVERGIPAVVAMRPQISIKAAALFTEHLFRNLARSGHVDAAANETRMQLYSNTRDDSEWGTPTLFMRLREGLLWQSPSEHDTTARPLRVAHAEAREPAADDEGMWEGLLPWIESGDFIPILGPGLNYGLLPSAEEIAGIWAEKHKYSLNRRPDLPSVAQYVEMKLGRHIPHQTLPKLLAQDLLEREQIHNRKTLLRQGLSKVVDTVAYRYFDHDENVYRILAELPISTYVTTNYDNFMSAALRLKGKKPQRRACVWKKDLGELSAIREYEDLEGTPERPLVFHLYGNDLDPTSQVVTEDDYLDFLGVIVRDIKHRIPSALQEGLSDSMLLFLGYNLDDLDCRVLFRGLVNQLKEPHRERRAVLQLEGNENDKKKDEEVARFMEKTCKYLDIDVHWGSVHDFLKELRKQWRAENVDL